jgi:hypothetical protein
MTESSNGGTQRGRPSSQSGGTADLHELATRLGVMARELEAEDDTEAMLRRIVTDAVALIPGADEGSISVVIARSRVTSQAPSGELPQRVDHLQEEVGEGPCLDAAYQHQTVRVPDMEVETRWPNFARRAADEAGVRSMLSFQLYVEGDNLGALNLYAKSPNAFADESEAVGLIFAAHAAVAFAGQRKEDQLRRGIDSRDLIGQAKGILMERHKIDNDTAFRVLAKFSQDHNIRLQELAATVALTGAFPDQG